VVETLLPDVPFDTKPRILGRARIKKKCLSWIRSTRDLVLVRLIDGEDLAQVDQDIWLVTSESSQYSDTRVWAQAIRNVLRVTKTDSIVPIFDSVVGAVSHRPREGGSLRSTEAGSYQHHWSISNPSHVD